MASFRPFLRRYLACRCANTCRAWLPGRDIWKEHGVWGDGPDGQPVLLRPDYFRQVGGREVVFYTDYLKPLINRFAREIRSVAPEAMVSV